MTCFVMPFTPQICIRGKDIKKKNLLLTTIIPQMLAAFRY